MTEPSRERACRPDDPGPAMRGAAAIAAGPSAPDPTWQPLPLPGWSSAFLTWPPRADGEAGPPPATIARIAEILAASAPALFLATGPDQAPETPWTQAGTATQQRIATTSGTLRRQGAPPRLRLVLTQDTATLAGAFDQPGFDWTQRGQLILLLEPAASLPPPADIFATMASDPPDTLPPTCIALLRPGTDGDFAELAARDPATLSGLVHRLTA